jgi:glutathione peroxidase
MKTAFVRIAILLFLIGGAAMSRPAGAADAARSVPVENAYDFSFDAIDGGSLPLSQYRGHPILLVNTASFCGYTPQYTAIQDLWKRYRDRGLVVIGVPSNDFGGQEPGTAEEIKSFCEVNFDVDFPLAGKARVVGVDAHPFYRWARGALGDKAAPQWNFHKYLVGSDGRLAGWFPTSTSPTAPEVVKAVEAELAAPQQ